MIKCVIFNSGIDSTSSCVVGNHEIRSRISLEVLRPSFRIDQYSAPCHFTARRVHRSHEAHRFRHQDRKGSKCYYDSFQDFTCQEEMSKIKFFEIYNKF